MRRSHLRRNAWAPATMAMLLMGNAAASPSPALPARDLLLAVSINGTDSGEIGSFHVERGRISATAAELRALGLVPPAGAAPDARIDLADMPGVKAVLDERAQSLALAVPVRFLPAHEIGGSPVRAVATASSPLGALFTYDATVTERGGSIDAYGLLSTRLFGAAGTLQNDLSVVRNGSHLQVVRLDTTYSWSDPARLRTYAVGDVLSGALGSSRSLRLGGVQVSTNFALRPDLVTYPLPLVTGGAAVPSTVDVLVNGVRQLNTSVAAGPFSIPQLPMVTGAGQVSVAVRDAAGHQTIQTSSFYTSSALLRPGLSSVSLEAGAIRRDYGTSSDDYGPLAASATGRRGLTPWLTIEGHAELAAHVALADMGAVAKLGGFGVGTVAVGASRSTDAQGVQSFVAFDRTTPRYHLGVSALLSTRGYRDLGTLVGDAPPAHVIQANAGLTFGRQGSFGIAYTDVRQRASDGARGGDIYAGNGLFAHAASRTSLLSATYSRELFGRIYAYATGYGDLRNGSRAASIGVSVRFGARGSINTSYDSAAHQATLEASRPALDPGDIGWRAYAAGGASGRLLGEMRYRGSAADVGVGLDHSGGSTFIQANARGSVVAMAGSVFAANSITDGFALVDTGSVGNVAVSLNNRPVGRTDAAGKLLVPGLVSYQPNSIAIDPTDLPLDVDWDRLDSRLSPAQRSGMVARFGVHHRHQAVVTLRMADGRPVPVGARVLDGSQTLVSGFDGQIYYQDLVGAGHKLSVTLPDGHACAADLMVLATTSWPASLQVTCHLLTSAGSASGS